MAAIEGPCMLQNRKIQLSLGGELSFGVGNPRVSQPLHQSLTRGGGEGGLGTRLPCMHVSTEEEISTVKSHGKKLHA